MSGYRYTGGFWRRHFPAGENPMNQTPLIIDVSTSF